MKTSFKKTSVRKSELFKLKRIYQAVRKPAALLLVLAASFLFGRGLAYVNYGKSEPPVQEVSGIALSSENWGLGFGQEGSRPTGNVSAEELK